MTIGSKIRILAETKCHDTLLEIAGRKFFGVSKKRCVLASGDEAEVIDGPIQAETSEGKVFTAIKIKHLSNNEIHEGWIAATDAELCK